MAYTESVPLRARMPAEKGQTDRSNSKEDASLLRRMAEGDERALGEVFDRHSGQVYGLCLRVLRVQADAEDVMQEIFLELWRRPERYDAGRGSLRLYLSQLARSRSIDRLRQHRRRAEVLREANGELEMRTAAVSPRAPDAAAAASEQSREVCAALQSLPEPQRTALILSYFEGLTYSEIAERSGEPIGTIKTRVRRALLRLRQPLVEWSEATLRGGDEE